MNFPVSDDVRDLLAILREEGFDWIADEINGVIKEGKAIDKLVVRGKSKRAENVLETATVEFSIDEQLAIALSCIREYTINAAKLFGVIHAEIAEPLRPADHASPNTQGKLTIQLVSDEDAMLATINAESASTILSPDVVQALALLEARLGESWPSSQGAYGSRTRGVERQVQ